MFRAWFRFSFNNPILIALGTMAISTAAPAADKLPSLLAKVQAEYKKTGGVEAEFDQTVDVKSTRQSKKAKGKIWIKRPNKLRWETVTPDPNILVSDGKTFWFYTPPFEKGERGQVIIKKSAQVQTKFLNALLSGTFEFGKQTSIEEKSSNSFILKPKAGTAGDVQTAEVIVNEQSHKIQEVILTHTSGNRTDIKLQDIKLQGKLEDKMFQFSPDKNTDRIVE